MVLHGAVKMKNKKFVIMGRSGSGKDTVAQLLTEEFGLKRLRSMTTRPKRFEDEDSYIFVTDEVAAGIGNRISETFINGYQYFATKEQMENSDMYIFDLCGLVQISRNAPDLNVVVLYLDADADVRKKRAMERAAYPEIAVAIFDKRNADEDPMFSFFESEIENGCKRLQYIAPVVTSVIKIDNKTNDIETLRQQIKNIFGKER